MVCSHGGRAAAALSWWPLPPHFLFTPSQPQFHPNSCSLVPSASLGPPGLPRLPASPSTGLISWPWRADRLPPCWALGPWGPAVWFLQKGPHGSTAGAFIGIMFAPFDSELRIPGRNTTVSHIQILHRRGPGKGHTSWGQPGRSLLAKMVALSNGCSEWKPTTLLAGIPWESWWNRSGGC